MRNKQSSYKIKKEPIQTRIQAKIKRKVSNKAAVILLPIYPYQTNILEYIEKPNRLKYRIQMMTPQANSRAPTQVRTVGALETPLIMTKRTI